MTKKTETVAVPQTETSEELGVAHHQPDQWVRQTALEFAITFHKNNGGMTQPNMVVVTATIFLDFIQGESK
jgi:hypothetical protein